MTDDIKPLNLNSEAESQPKTDQPVADKPQLEPTTENKGAPPVTEKAGAKPTAVGAKPTAATTTGAKPITTEVKSGGSKMVKSKMLSWVLILVFLGIGTGYGLYTFTKPKSPKKLATEVKGELNTGDIFGVEDEAVFRDTVEGTLMTGGIDGEGSHHLEREGGESQTVYVTSSVIDLDQFLDKKVKVWGETFEAQKAGWLMDVGRLAIQ